MSHYFLYVLGLGLVLATSTPALGSTICVGDGSGATSGARPGDCRQGVCQSTCRLVDALALATETLGDDTIVFETSGEIQLDGTMQIPSHVSINGFLQAGQENDQAFAWNATPLVFINGQQGSFSCFQAGDDVTIRNLAFHGCGTADKGAAILATGDRVSVLGNAFGLDSNLSSAPNFEGVRVVGTSAQIGDIGLADRNLFVFGVARHIAVRGVDAQVVNNFLGLNADGASGDASHLGTGVDIEADNTRVSGNFFASVETAVAIRASQGHQVANNRFGMSADGSMTDKHLKLANALSLDGSNTTVENGNLFGTGAVSVGGAGTIVRGNSFGIDATGHPLLGVDDHASSISVSSASTTTQIGGAAIGDGNTFCMQSSVAVRINGQGVVVEGNLFGVDPVSDTSCVQAGTTGVALQEGAQNNRIGGTIVGAKNRFGRYLSAIEVRQSSGVTANNDIFGNKLGLASDGSSCLTGAGSASNGIFVMGGNNLRIGDGTNAGANHIACFARTIARLNLNTVSDPSPTVMKVLNNHLENTNPEALIENVTGAILADQSPAPGLIAALSVAGQTRITGTVDTNLATRVDFYAGNSCSNMSIHLGFSTVSSLQPFTHSLGSALAPGLFVRSLSTLDEGSTSLLSNCVSITQPGQVEFVEAATNLAENAGDVQIALRRVGGAAGALSIGVQLTNSAFAPDLLVPNTIVFADGQTTASLIVNITNDSIPEPLEAPMIALTSAEDNLFVGATAQHLITIADNDCGNSVIDAGEACDDGNTQSGDGCSSTCAQEFCGDGVANNTNEICDDGGNDPGDGCSATCVIEVCGDGVANNNGEQCDDGGATSGDGCSAVCVVEFCGDGILNNTNETCDDGNVDGGDGCNASCQLEFCGDGTMNGSEACDGTFTSACPVAGSTCGTSCECVAPLLPEPSGPTGGSAPAGSSGGDGTAGPDGSSSPGGASSPAPAGSGDKSPGAPTVEVKTAAPAKGGCSAGGASDATGYALGMLFGWRLIVRRRLARG